MSDLMFIVGTVSLCALGGVALMAANNLVDDWFQDRKRRTRGVKGEGNG